MAISLHLAMTSAEISVSTALPEKIAYMACHFSPYGTGLSNLPQSLPKDSILILNDRTPICGHDPKLILYQLEQTVEALQCSGVLLDFQRPDSPETADLCRALADSITCPIAVSSLYAGALECPVFLPPCPPDTAISAYLEPWKGRDIWLEAAQDTWQITIRESGSTFSLLSEPSDMDFPHWDESLFCHYRTDIFADSIIFTLTRTHNDLSSLLLQAEALGVKQAVGLWQELKIEPSVSQ